MIASRGGRGASAGERVVVPIRLLDAETIGQIAAGEIVERPLSVVKELVENALDAGATRIAVSLAHGGIAEIDVADDGVGIAQHELPLALRRHATSKLADAHGLTTIDTLGFRGEGLAAIAAVSHVTVISRTPGSDIAHAIEAHGETVGDPHPAAAPAGTRVIVRDLFAAVPARREYLRAPSTELARISSFLGSLALAYPRVAISLRNDGKPVFAFGANDDPAERLMHVFGHDNDRRMLPIVPRDDDFVAVRGYVSAPGHDRPDRRGQLLFINGRLLRSTLLSGAWTAAYRTFAMVGRHPFGVLFLDVVTRDVDPNVHPTKSDVRLRYGERVVTAAREAIGTTLRRAASERIERSLSLAPRIDGVPANPAASYDAPLELLPAGERQRSRLRVLAQVDATFVLATDGEAVVLVDQHAAHERVVFEELGRNARAERPSEPLLVPHVVELAAADAAQLDKTIDALAASGLEIEPFGERTYRIVATPVATAFGERVRAFDVMGFLDGLSDDVRGLTGRERVWASLACHSVVRAGERLATDEMTTLLERLERCENPMHCPHGRPTIVRLEPDQIARLFKRL